MTLSQRATAKRRMAKEIKHINPREAYRSTDAAGEDSASEAGGELAGASNKCKGPEKMPSLATGALSLSFFDEGVADFDDMVAAVGGTAQAPHHSPRMSNDGKQSAWILTHAR